MLYLYKPEKGLFQMNRILPALLLLIIIPQLLSSQRRGGSRNRYRYEAVFSLGAANILGDLGGADQVGTNGLKDFELNMTKFVVGVGMRYKTTKYTGVKANLYYAQVSGNDALTLEPYRHNRNLHFRSPIIEMSVQFEGYITREQQGHLYKIRNVKGRRHKDLQIYGFGGIAGFYFNPKAKYINGAWYALQPLGTEGQGLIEGTSKYKRIGLAIPVGIGLKHAIGKQYSLGIELGIRKTFTDYLDDVSTVYYKDTMGVMSPMAVYFADPSLRDPVLTTNVDVTGHGQQRGDPTDKDAYMFGTITLNYKIPYRRTRSKF